ncbi:hypothetical protein BHU72_14450 [Desulfuribacillus stibiiarsenatis]|uniref:Uncharacterized protein n=1 Tax=Desulfuribacillus stibiiarsenatis TaxID=1390249 RepID=A0A1E5L804_9FIRM|nr:hypothetical protein [Desulfuribacillus stibiiarsenatis]OEH86119.1 hypothetical protein BHU72_14450 [Desulfuribacillus stibiiarsenatis]
MRNIGTYAFEGLTFIIWLLAIGTLFNVNIFYFKEYRLEYANLESAIKEIWPSSEIVNEWDLKGNKLFVFKTPTEYRYIFFPKGLISNRYALNDNSILHSYSLFDVNRPIRRQLKHFTGTYYVEISTEELIIEKHDRWENLSLYPLFFQILISIGFISYYTNTFIERYKIRKMKRDLDNRENIG